MRKIQEGKSKRSQSSPKQNPKTATKEPDPEIGTQVFGPEDLNQNTQNHSARQIDSLLEKPSPDLTETRDEPAPKATDHRRRDKLEWYGSWEED